MGKRRFTPQQTAIAFRLVRHLIAMKLDQESCWTYIGNLINPETSIPYCQIADTTTTVASVVWHFVHKAPYTRHEVISRSCENPLCLRHLYREDRRELVRVSNRRKFPKGHVPPGTKINREIAQQIRFDHRPVKELIQVYGLSQSNIYKIKRRKLWK